MNLVFDTGMGIPGGYADMDITGTGTDGHFHIRRHTPAFPRYGTVILCCSGDRFIPDLTRIARFILGYSRFNY